MTEENRPVGKASEGRLLWMYDKIISVEEFQHIVCAKKITKKRKQYHDEFFRSSRFKKLKNP